MNAGALALVVLASVFHVTWNVLAKASRDKLVFFWWTGVVGVAMFLPAVLWWQPLPAWSSRIGLGLAAGAVIRGAYFASLGMAYARGDLSLVYPLARGTAPVLVPIAAALLLGERLSLAGGLGVATVAVGVYVLHLPGLSRGDLLAPLAALRGGHARYALLTGLLTTSYSLVDKWNMDSGVSPLLYAYATIPGAALLLSPLVGARASAAAEWRAGGWRIAAVAFLMTAGYLLVLFALRIDQVSYVAPARELGIVWGALAGSTVLKEGRLTQRVAGALVIVLGVALIAFAGTPR